MAFSSIHLYFDDLAIGQEWMSPGRTVGECDIMTYAGFSGDFNPMHIDEEFAKTTPFRKRICHGFGVFSMASGLGVSIPPVRTIALFSVRNWSFLYPVFIGDTIKVRAKVVEKTVRGRGKRGEVVWQRTILNQHDKVVQEGEVVTLIECRPLPKPGSNGAAPHPADEHAATPS